MTRTYSKEPVWTWYCDICGRTSGDLAWNQAGLPTIKEMRERGWRVPEGAGDDVCVTCQNEGRAFQTPTDAVPQVCSVCGAGTIRDADGFLAHDNGTGDHLATLAEPDDAGSDHAVR